MVIADGGAVDDLDVGPELVVATVVVLAIGVLILAFWRDFWSGRKAVPGGGLYGERGVKVVRSIYPYIGIPALAFGLALLFGCVAATLPPGSAEAAVMVGVFVVVIVVVLTWALLLTIVLFNRPRRLVPPHARDFEGYLGEAIRERWPKQHGPGR